LYNSIGLFGGMADDYVAIGGYLAHLRHIDFSPTQKSSLPQHG
jgi:hypothetical protein